MIGSSKGKVYQQANDLIDTQRHNVLRSVLSAKGGCILNFTSTGFSFEQQSTGATVRCSDRLPRKLKSTGLYLKFEQPEQLNSYNIS
ncbi:MAG: hypothetical protein LBT09_03945 [Planctomycetaceae bacterium]|nr:hypothetical protein [Planctomycetaceae bacterium]